MSIYNEIFKDEMSVLNEFSIDKNALNGCDIIFAHYTYEDYSGDAFVLLRDSKDGKLYEVNGSHCSCYGLEGQWDMEETTLELLNKRNYPYFNDVVKSMIEKMNITDALNGQGIEVQMDKQSRRI